MHATIMKRLLRRSLRGLLLAAALFTFTARSPADPPLSTPDHEKTEIDLDIVLRGDVRITVVNHRLQGPPEAVAALQAVLDPVHPTYMEGHGSIQGDRAYYISLFLPPDTDDRKLQAELQRLLFVMDVLTVRVVSNRPAKKAD